MKKLNEGYIDILKRNENTSTNYWTLLKKINNDSKMLVQLLKTQNLNYLIIYFRLLYSKVITFTDLNKFSEELQNDLKSKFYKKL